MVSILIPEPRALTKKEQKTLTPIFIEFGELIVEQIQISFHISSGVSKSIKSLDNLSGKNKQHFLIGDINSTNTWLGSLTKEQATKQLADIQNHQASWLFILAINSFWEHKYRS